jgi:acyl carrier protein
MDTLKLIYSAIDEINEDLEASEQIVKSEDTEIFGGDQSLDSLQLVNLITIVEQNVEEETGDFISLADERAMSMESSPFKTVGTLKQYLDTLLNERER